MRSCATRSTKRNGPEHTGFGAELLAGGLCRLRRDHHPGAVGELREQRREGRRQVEPRRHRIDDVDARHQRELAPPVRPGHRLVALDVVLDGGGVELLAVVEGDAGPKLQRQRLAVRRPLPGRGELRDDVQLLVDVEELVAERREHDAPDEGPRERRIEHVRILGEADAQRLRLRRDRHTRGQRQRNPTANGPVSDAHRCLLRRVENRGSGSSNPARRALRSRIPARSLSCPRDGRRSRAARTRPPWTSPRSGEQRHISVSEKLHPTSTCTPTDPGNESTMRLSH